MKRNHTACTLIVLLFAVLSVTVAPARAQQPAGMRRLGYLSVLTPAAVAERLAAFRQAMGELGYAEEQNISMESRYAEGQFARMPELAAELVRLKVDAILSAGPATTGHAMKQTSTIPIVMAFDTDPVGNGFVSSLARPGAHGTGL